MAHIFCSSINQAIHDRNIEELQKLIRKRKRIHAPDNLGWSPLHAGVKKNRKDVVETLLNHSENEVNCRTAEGCTNLLLISGLPNLDLGIAKDFLDLGADPNIPNNEGMYPLHVACKHINLELVKLLIHHQANANCQDFDGRTPLHFAIEVNSPELIEYLLAHNADANLTQTDGANALMLAMRLQPSSFDLLLSHTRNLDAVTECSWTALLFGIQSANIHAVRTLLEHGASLTACKSEYLALGSAVLVQCYEVFELIWQYTDLKTVSKNKHFMALICEYCPLPRCYKYYELILNTPGVDLNMDGVGALFCNITECEPPNSVVFDTAKKQFLDVIGWMLDRNLVLGSTDMKSMLWYFKKCPNTLELWKMVLAKSSPNITQQIVAEAIKYESYSIALLLVTYCLHLNAENVVDVQVQLAETFWRNWWAFFTPDRKKITDGVFQMSGNAMNIINDANQVKSLLELSRDSVREAMQNSCNTTQEFLDALAKLEIPIYLKDVVRLRIPVNKYLLED